jgi:hypothetical protein
MFLEYDYTFTTPYRGSLRRYPPGPTRPIEIIGRDAQVLKNMDGAGRKDSRGAPLLGAEMDTSRPGKEGTSGNEASRMEVDENPETGSSKAGLRTGDPRLSSTQPGSSNEHAESAAGPSALDLRWEPSDSGIDLELLTARDPILFYDEVSQRSLHSQGKVYRLVL